MITDQDRSVAKRLTKNGLPCLHIDKLFSPMCKSHKLAADYHILSCELDRVGRQ